MTSHKMFSIFTTHGFQRLELFTDITSNDVILNRYGDTLGIPKRQKSDIFFFRALKPQIKLVLNT